MNNSSDKNLPILIITDNAKTHIETFIKPLGERAGFRVGIKKSGCSGFSYVADVVAEPNDTDICISHNGIQIFIAANSVEVLHGTTIDLIDKGFGQKQLSFVNSRAESYCGCGESFIIKSEQDEQP